MIHEHLASVRKTIAEAAIKTGRAPEAIKLVAVSKTVGIDRINEAVAAGQTLFGENYPQEAADKIKMLSPSLSWHLIGHLQSNKVKLAVDLFDVIETVDSWKIAQAINRQAKARDKSMSVLLQVNIGREAQKSGVHPDDAEALLRQITRETGLHVLGLMTIPPFFDNPEKSRPYFKQLHAMASRFAALCLFKDNDNVELSMGMSHDYPIAIEEGATIVRVGTAIFGAR